MEPNDEINLSVRERVKAGVKAVFEQLLEEEMTEHLQAEYRERTYKRRGERNGHRYRDLITPVGQIEQLQVPRDREGEFFTEVFERYQRMTGDVEEAVLEMYLQGVSTRRVGSITQPSQGSRSARTRSAGSQRDSMRKSPAGGDAPSSTPSPS